MELHTRVLKNTQIEDFSRRFINVDFDAASR